MTLEPPAADVPTTGQDAPARSSAPPAISPPPAQQAEVSARKDAADDALSAAQRIELLEQRVAALEAAVAEAQIATHREKARLKWLPQGTEPDLSEWRANVLCHNLGTIPAHQITIQFRSGDDDAWRTACWLKKVFERATWLAQGPIEAPKDWPSAGLCLSTTLPVPPRPAATFMAIRAAGFALHASFDPDLRGDEARLVVA